MKIGSYFDVVLKYEIPVTVWNTKNWTPDTISKWCHQNLQSGYDIIHLNIPIEKWIITVTDDTDYDLLIMTWGR